MFKHMPTRENSLPCMLVIWFNNYQDFPKFLLCLMVKYLNSNSDLSSFPPTYLRIFAKRHGLLKPNNNTVILPTKSPVLPWHPIMCKPHPVTFVWQPCAASGYPHLHLVCPCVWWCPSFSSRTSMCILFYSLMCWRDWLLSFFWGYLFFTHSSCISYVVSHQAMFLSL